MNKVALTSLVVAAVAVGVVAGVYAPRWLPNGAPATATATPSKNAAPARKVEPTRVALADVAAIDFTRGISAVGSLRSDEAVVLRPEVAGRIRAIRFKEGQPVVRDDVLVQLDDAIPRAELAQARANLSLAQSQYRRASELQGRGFVSQQARDEAGSTLKVQEAAAALAQAKLDKLTIRAPFSGVAGLRSVSEGDFVDAGQDLAPLEAIDPLKVDFRVPEMYLSRVQTGQTLSVRLDALPGELREGKVYAISPLVDAGGRSILLRAIVPNADRRLRPGMFARVQLTFSQDRANVVPEAALSPSGDSQYVFVVRDGVARRVEVAIGERRDGRVEVISGVTAGDRVVVSGLQRVIDGGPVVDAGPGA